MKIKIVIYEPKTENHEAINTCFGKTEGTDIVLVTELEEAEKLFKITDKYIFSLSDNEKEEIKLAEKIIKTKPVIVLKHENNMLGFGKFRPDLNYYWRSGIFKLNNAFSWEIALKELNNIH